MAACSASAASALKAAIESEQLCGTLVYIAAPSEEIWLARFIWHPMIWICALYGVPVARRPTLTKAL